MGDLLDSFIFPIEDQVRLVREVLDDIENGDVDCIHGNHELSYCIPKMRCSGYDEYTNTLIQPMKNRMKNLLKPFIYIEEGNILITHAGLCKKFYDCMPESKNKGIGEIANLLADSWNKESDVLNIGYSRGGRSTYPGIFWSDWSQDFNPVEGITQVFGHTPGKEIRKKGDNWCIDCLPSTNHDRTRTPMGVLIDGKEITEIQLV